MPINIDESKRPLEILALVARNMPLSTKALWQSRLTHVYGDMKGQRAVDFAKLQKNLNLDATSEVSIDVVIALETYFYLVSNLIAYASFQNDPSYFLKQIHILSPKKFRSFLTRLINGALFEEQGIYGCMFAFDFDWILDGCTEKSLQELRDELSKLARLWNKDQLLIPGHDPFQILHHSLFPKNLLHITGQFYTPEWLAELLLRDVGWTPDKKLLDPFCGSGVFMVRALKYATNLGASISDVLPNLLGIDLNPVASSAARANLALYIGRLKLKNTSAYHLNVISADALAPAITAGQNKSSKPSLWNASVNIDGETVGLPDLTSKNVRSDIAYKLSEYGLSIGRWMSEPMKGRKRQTTRSLSARDRRIWEQFFVYALTPADIVVTNPPWVGWEYISRPYRETITDAWRLYDLFKVSGLDAAFLKEDLSSLALMTAWDFFLKNGGRSAVVLRPAIMFSSLAARGMRRLSLADNGIQFNLKHIRTFSSIRVFTEAETDVATWEIEKGGRTKFPIKVTEWRKDASRWYPNTSTEVEEVLTHIRSNMKYASRTDPDNLESRWIIAEHTTLKSFASLQGTNDYVPRMGVFTGGANAVYYLEVLDDQSSKETGIYRNIIDRAKRPAPLTVAVLEKKLIYSVLRGRDIQMWNARPEVYLLCPHTRKTRMYPLEEKLLESEYPYAYKYLKSMQHVLMKREGFAGWEKTLLQKCFYTLQRVGEYTFAPYKVCWKYIASEFTVCVVDGDDKSKPILPNDKVMFIPFEDAAPAYFLGGLLSSTIVRGYVNSSTSKRQISTDIIKSLELPPFNSEDSNHTKIAATCYQGHAMVANNDEVNLRLLREELDQQVSRLFKIQTRETVKDK